MLAVVDITSWYMTIISEVKENEENEESAMFLTCWHAMSQSVSHAFSCLKFMLFRASNPDIWRPLARSKRAERTKRTRCFEPAYTRYLSLFLMSFDASNACYSMPQMHAILYLKSWCTSWCMATISEIREGGESAMFLACLHAMSLPVSHAIACLKCMPFRASNACYSVPQIVMYDDY